MINWPKKQKRCSGINANDVGCEYCEREIHSCNCWKAYNDGLAACIEAEKSGRISVKEEVWQSRPESPLVRLDEKAVENLIGHLQPWTSKDIAKAICAKFGSPQEAEKNGRMSIDEIYTIIAAKPVTSFSPNRMSKRMKEQAQAIHTALYGGTKPDERKKECKNV